MKCLQIRVLNVDSQAIASNVSSPNPEDAGEREHTWTCCASVGKNVIFSQPGSFVCWLHDLDQASCSSSLRQHCHL